MTKARNGWDAWYDQWDERYVDEPGDDSHPIPYEHLTFWGERFRNESDLRVDYPNGGRIKLYGADDPDALRGMYFDAVVLDEYADMRPAFLPGSYQPGAGGQKVRQAEHGNRGERRVGVDFPGSRVQCFHNDNNRISVCQNRDGRHCDTPAQTHLD